MTKNKAANNFFESLKDNPQEIIAWCKEEINAYERLIELIENMSGVEKEECDAIRPEDTKFSK